MVYLRKWLYWEAPQFRKNIAVFWYWLPTLILILNYFHPLSHTLSWWLGGYVLFIWFLLVSPVFLANYLTSIDVNHTGLIFNNKQIIHKDEIDRIVLFEIEERSRWGRGKFYTLNIFKRDGKKVVYANSLKNEPEKFILFCKTMLEYGYPVQGFESLNKPVSEKPVLWDPKIGDSYTNRIMMIWLMVLILFIVIGYLISKVYIQKYLV